MPGRRVRTPDGVIHDFPADATDEEISAALSAPPATARGLAKARSWTDTAVDALPAAGGTLGGIIGGIGGTVAGLGVGGIPGSIGGATLGGAAGEAARQLVNRIRGAGAPTTPLAAAMDIGTEAGLQGGSELAGHGLMKGAGMAAHGLMDFAIRPAPTVAEEFGDIAATALKERIPVGNILPGMRKGSQKARALMRESGQHTRGLLADARQAGTSFNPQDVGRGPFLQLVRDIAKQPLSDSELNQVSRMFGEYLDTHGAQMSPNALKDMKQAAQRIAKPIFRAIHGGNVVPAGESLKAQFNAAIAEGAKDALETIPGMATSEARTQGLIGATKAIRRAEVRRLPLVAEVAAPAVGAAVGATRGNDMRSRGESAGTGLASALVLRAALSPRSTSRAALGLTAPAIQEALRQMPRAAVYQLLDDLQKQGEGQQ